jgi:hypothetical protein
MYDRYGSEITGIQVVIPTSTSSVTYQIVEDVDGWQIHDPFGAVVERAATVDRALSIAACLSAMGSDAVGEPFTC